MPDLNRLSAQDGNTVFHHGINNARDLAFLGIYDLHDAYRWYNKNVRRVPGNSIRVLRVAQSVWTFTMNTTTGKHSAMNVRTGFMKLLPNLRKNPLSTNQYARFLRDMATSTTVSNRDRGISYLSGPAQPLVRPA